MATTKDDIRGWFESGMDQGAAYMLVVCDQFDWEDYPVYVMLNENLAERAKTYDGQNMQKIMECYDLAIPMEKQLSQKGLVFNGLR